MEKKVLFYHAQTSVHCGSGSSLEVIDLPIQREKHSGFPIFRASSVKGSIRRFYTGENVNSIFGPETGNDFASCISFTDARLLFFPVKSFKKVFVWVTCPYVLERFKNDLENIGLNCEDWKIPDINENDCVVSGDKLTVEIEDNKKIVLEEQVLNLSNGTIDIPIDFVNKTNVLERLVVVSDDLFSYFVKTATEVVARTKINNETGVVQKGALWYEENLPAESILYSLVFANKSRDKGNMKEAKEVLSDVEKNVNKVIQFGGNETIGRGLVKLQWNDLTGGNE